MWELARAAYVSVTDPVATYAVSPFSSHPADPEVVRRELGTDEQVRPEKEYTLAPKAIFVKSVWDSGAWIRETD